MSSEEDRQARKARAEERRSRMTVEVVPMGLAKPPPYAHASPEARLEAAVRLMGYHNALLNRSQALPRSEWPGEIFKCGDGRG